MPLSAEVDKFVKVASASLPRVSEIIAAFSDADRAGALERRYAQAACTSNRRAECDLTLILKQFSARSSDTDGRGDVTTECGTASIVAPFLFAAGRD